MTLYRDPEWIPPGPWYVLPQPRVRYEISIEWSAEDREFIATCAKFPTLSGCDADFGKARMFLQDAIEMALEVMIEDGDPVPVSEGLDR